MRVAEARVQLQRLAASTQAILGPIGVAAELTEEARAYLSLLEDRAVLALVREQLATMTTSATPAGRIYAALLLRSLDPRAGTSALEQMLDSDEPCPLWLGGCGPLPVASLGAAATFLLGRGNSAPAERQRSHAWLRILIPMASVGGFVAAGYLLQYLLRACR